MTILTTLFIIKQTVLKIKMNYVLKVHPDIALIKLLGVLPNLYQAALYYVLWVTGDITDGDSL
jgi:hypothetical protein